MRIAVVNNFFPPRPGGSSHLSDALARRYAEAGHEVLVLTAAYGGAPPDETRDGMRIVRIPSWNLPKTRFAANFDIGFTMSPRTRRQVYDLLDAFHPDVVHQHGQFFDLTWMTGFWSRSRGVPTLLSIHTRLYSPVRINRAIYRIADAILVAPLMRVHRPRLVVMDVLMDAYVDSRYRRAISGKDYIPVGIDPKALAGGSASTIRDRDDLRDAHIILSLGHVIPQRGRLPLVEALPTILSSHPTARVVVVGGVYDETFLRRADELGVRHAIITVGARSQNEVRDYLAAADLEVHELEGQGFGTASLESLAIGIPVVAAVRPDNFVGLRLDDQRELYLVPFRDGAVTADPAALARTIIGILDDPSAARARVVAGAQKFIDENFTIERVSRRHLEVFEIMCAADGSSVRG